MQENGYFISDNMAITGEIVIEETEILSMTLQWYVLQSKSRKENILFNQVTAKNITCFFPQVKYNPVNPRAAKVRPYFPNYMFVQLNLDETRLSTFQWMPFSKGLVIIGGEPTPVPDNLIVALRARVQVIYDEGGVKPKSFEPGTPVHVIAGPFKGYEAIFDAQLPGRERARVLLKLLSRQAVPLELPVSQIQRTKHP